MQPLLSAAAASSKDALVKPCGRRARQRKQRQQVEDAWPAAP